MIIGQNLSPRHTPDVTVTSKNRSNSGWSAAAS